jgi:3-oxoacyl-[acyl-carrier-protein] synthase-3
MPKAKFESATITGIAVAVPSRKINNLEREWDFPQSYVRDAIAKTGVRERRWAEAGVCASDLCFEAASELLSDMEIESDSVDAVIFVSQGPDYVLPMTAALLQERLRLGNDTAAFDVSIGCSGYVYGLMLAFSLVESGGFRKVLLLNGEIATRRYSFRDGATAFLFGDSGAATMVESSKKRRPSVFSLATDGSKADAIAIKAGGSRHPSTPATRLERKQANGGYRSDEQGHMDGAEVFATVARVVPEQVDLCLKDAGLQKEDIDYFVFHQASRVVNEHVRKKLAIPLEKFPYSLEMFGNTSGVSIPLTIVTQISEHLRDQETTIAFSGFGVGMSWASAVVNLGRLKISKLVEVGLT